MSERAVRMLAVFLGGTSILITAEVPRTIRVNGSQIVVEQTTAARSERETPLVSATDPQGFLYLAGTSVDPATLRTELYVTKIRQDGSERLYTAQLGGWRTLRSIAIDASGSVILAGSTQTASGVHVFLSKLDPKGREWILDRSIAGSGSEEATAVALDPDGNILLAGWTTSSDFPVVRPVQENRIGDRDAFVAKLDPSGRDLVFSTFAGGGLSTEAAGVAAGLDRSIFVVGNIIGQGGRIGILPAAREDGDVFLLKLSADGQERIRAELFGGSGQDTAKGLAVNREGSVFVTGWTASRDFPVTVGQSPLGTRDSFVARFGPAGERLFVTLLGQAGDASLAIAADDSGNSYIAGTTRNADAFAVKLSADGERTLLDGQVGESAGGVTLAVDYRGRVYVGVRDLSGRSYVAAISSCEFRLSRASELIGANGGDSEVSIETSPECAWSAISHSPWIQAGQKSSGKNTVRFSVAANPGPPRAAVLAIGGQTLVVAQMGAAREAGGLTGPIRSNVGFQTNVISGCDDCSAASIANLGFSLNFYGTTYSRVYVNNNGNVTFSGPNSTYTPTSFAGIGNPIIAPFWADVDTGSTASGITRYGTDTVNGRPAFGVNWINVGYFFQNVDKMNSFQLVLIDRGDLGVGFFDIEMNYSSIQWETGDLSGGTNGIGGNSARAGFSNGTGAAGTYFELPGSAINGALLDGGGNSLAANSTNSGVTGRYIYGVRAGSIVCGTGISPTTATVPISGQTLTIYVTASNPACTWNVTGLPTWVHVTQPASSNGSGTAQVKLQVEPNTGAVRNVVISIAGQSYGINQSGTTSLGSPLRFVPVTPCRIADTRNAAGTFGGPKIAANSLRDFVIPSSACNIPSNAVAYSLNVTVVPSAPLGYLTIWPAGQSQPLVSTLNAPDGRVKANAAIVPAGAGGAVSVFVTAPTDVILDINGYFVPASGNSNLAFYPLTPCRIADTRNANGSLGGPIITGGTSKTFPVLSSSCGIPATAQAYSLNMTVVPSVPLGYITTWPAGQAQPLVSTLNAPTGTVVANAAIVPAGSGGSISVYASNTTHVIIDVNGYFAPPGSGGLAFYAATPCRICDTRNPAGAFGGPSLPAGIPRTFLVPQAGCNVPSSATAFSVNATVVPPPMGVLSYLTLFSGGTGLPFVSTLNAGDGAITSNAAIVPAGPNGGLGASATNLTDLILDINGYFAP